MGTEESYEIKAEINPPTPLEHKIVIGNTTYYRGAIYNHKSLGNIIISSIEYSNHTLILAISTTPKELWKLPFDRLNELTPIKHNISEENAKVIRRKGELCDYKLASTETWFPAKIVQVHEATLDIRYWYYDGKIKHVECTLPLDYPDLAPFRLHYDGDIDPRF
jgi:hypothetical protein